MLHFLLARFAMPYRRTPNVARKRAARHDAILAAACEAAAQGGMAAVQIAPVAARAGIATGTVYRYFPSKTDLVAALAAALGEREMAALEGAAKAAPGPMSALAAATRLRADGRTGRARGRPGARFLSAGAGRRIRTAHPQGARRRAAARPGCRARSAGASRRAGRGPPRRARPRRPRRSR